MSLVIHALGAYAVHAHTYRIPTDVPRKSDLKKLGVCGSWYMHFNYKTLVYKNMCAYVRMYVKILFLQIVNVIICAAQWLVELLVTN